MLYQYLVGIKQLTGMDIFWDATEGFLDHEALALPDAAS